jgi:hypothetical protein
MRRALTIGAFSLPGLAGLAIGGWAIYTNVINPSYGAGPPACTVLSASIAKGTLGPSARVSSRNQGPGYSHCQYSNNAGEFISVEVGRWESDISGQAPPSGKSNQASGSGTYLLHTALSDEATLAPGSALGHVARNGDVGVYVVAGHYGQFFGAAAVRELTFEDRVETKLVAVLARRI